MKLRTELIFGKHYDANAFINGNEEETDHDAMAAHALMQAMKDYVLQSSNTRATAWIKYRADELMREWGFE